MSDPLQFPKLRWPIDIRLEEAQGEKFLLLNCPLGITSKPLLLKPAVAPLIARFEGQLSLDDIASQFKDLGVHRDLVHRLAQLLDEHLFLATPRFFEAEAEVRRVFQNAPVRSAALAGLSYAATREALSLEIDNYLSGSTALVHTGATHASTSPQSLIGLVSPHIDYRRGGNCYGETYSHLRSSSHDLYIVMGTSHQYSPLLFHLTAKDFETPLGKLPNATAFSERLATRYGATRSFADEFLHRREHSLELQLPFLQRVRGNARICPILIGSFHSFLVKEREPHEFEEYEAFAAALAECVQEERRAGNKVCLIAGVDMAHIGTQFGDTETLNDQWMKEIESRDNEYLEAIKSHDKARLYRHILEDKDARRVCGFPTMYTLLDVLDRVSVRYQAVLYNYAQAVNIPAGCAVTFAGMGLYENLAQ